MIKEITLKNFRNHTMFHNQMNEKMILITGNNGSGKTSILESLYFCSATKSHRTNDDTHLIMEGKLFSSIKIKTDKHLFETIISHEGKRIFIDRVEIKRLSDFIGKLQIVLFAPEDLELIKGTPSHRRQFIDLEWMKLNKSYLKTLNDYKQALKQRNSLLKRLKIGDETTFLDIIGEQLYVYGQKMMQERETFINQLNIKFIQAYRLFQNRVVEIIYKPNVSIIGFKIHLQTQQKQDLLYQMTTAGPHKDDFYITLDGKDAKTYASQGEQRLIVVALKMALLEVIKEHTKEDVVMLLDDIFSELDLDKQHILLENIPKIYQTIMTSATPIIKEGVMMIELEKG